MYYEQFQDHLKEEIISANISSNLNFDPSTLYVSRFKWWSGCLANLISSAKQPLQSCRQKTGPSVSHYLHKKFKRFHGIMAFADLSVQPVHRSCKLSALWTLAKIKWVLFPELLPSKMVNIYSYPKTPQVETLFWSVPKKFIKVKSHSLWLCTSLAPCLL